MIPITSPYKYNKLERHTELNGVRQYKCPDNSLVYSVTTILGATADKTFLKDWRKRIGDSEADRITKESAGIGTLLHNHLESYILGIERPSGNNIARVMAKNMADTVIGRGLCNISEVWGVEASLHYPGLYAGTTDLVAVHNKEPAICDYKNTRKPKKREWVNDYMLQLTAYMLAHNELYNTNIKKGVIFMVSRDCQYQEFILEGLELQQTKEEWTRRLEMFYEFN